MEVYSSSFSKLIRLLANSDRLSVFCIARLILILPCSDRFSFLRISPKGAFIKVSGVRISCAVLIKNRIFSFELFLSFLSHK